MSVYNWAAGKNSFRQQPWTVGTTKKILGRFGERERGGVGREREWKEGKERLEMNGDSYICEAVPSRLGISCTPCLNFNLKPFAIHMHAYTTPTPNDQAH